MDNEEKTLKKWAPILDSMGLTGSKADWMTEYTNKQTETLVENTLASEDTSSDFPSLLPIVMRVAAKTISQDIGGFASKEEIDSVKNRITQENRDGKIESIIDDKPFTEKKLEEDQE